MAKTKGKDKNTNVTTEEPTSETTVVISDITEVDGPTGVVEETATTEEPTPEEPTVDTTIEGGGKKKKKKSKKKSKKKR